MSAELRITGVKELKASFRQVDRDFGGKEATGRLKDAYREVSVRAAADARAGAAGGTPLQQKMAGAIKPKVTVNRGAGISINSSKSYPAAKVAFWGIDKRTGWFAAQKFNRYNAVDQKLPPWVGAAWLAAVPGQGPHRINDALAAHTTVYVELFEVAVYRAMVDVGLV